MKQKICRSYYQLAGTEHEDRQFRRTLLRCVPQRASIGYMFEREFPASIMEQSEDELLLNTINGLY